MFHSKDDIPACLICPCASNPAAWMLTKGYSGGGCSLKVQSLVPSWGGQRVFLCQKHFQSRRNSWYHPISPLVPPISSSSVGLSGPSALIPDLHWDLYLIPVWGFPGSLLCEHSSQWCRGGCKTEDNQMNPGRRGRFAALVGCNCNNLTVTQEGSTETSRQAEHVSNNRFYRWLKTHTWVWMALFSQPLSCSSVTPQFSFCQNPQVFKASADRENMEEKTVLFHRGVRILWKPSGHLMLAPSL